MKRFLLFLLFLLFLVSCSAIVEQIDGDSLLGILREIKSLDSYTLRLQDMFIEGNYVKGYVLIVYIDIETQLINFRIKGITLQELKDGLIKLDENLKNSMF